MLPYVAVPLFACAASTAFGAAILSWNSRRRANRLIGYVVLGAAFWAFCEVLWLGAERAETVVWLNRAASLGWLFVGPLMASVGVEVSTRPPGWMRRVVPFLYAGSLAFLAVTWTTPWMVEGAVRTSFGWGMVPGPLFPAFYVFTFACLALATVAWLGGASARYARIEGRQRLFVSLAFGLPIIGTSVTDAVLPVLGVQTPRLGTLCFAFFAGMVVWSLQRYGYALLAPESFSRRILRALPDGVALVSTDGIVRTANSRMAALLGCSIDDAIGLPIAEHLSVPVVDPLSELREVDCRLVSCDGRPIPVSVSSTPLLDNAGDPVGVVLIVRDTREVVALRNRLVTSGRLAAVGELAAGIAHEINNPLAFVRSNLGLLRREWDAFAAELEKVEGAEALRGLSAGWEELIDESLEGVDRAVLTVRDVNEFSHAGAGGREPADLNALIDQALRVAAPQLGGRIRVEKRYGDLPPVACAPQRLKQLFLNLVVNAAHAIRGPGRIRIATEHRGGHVTVSVQDDGCGIEADTLERIFDPFFTTKPVGVGTGLGLSISHEIVRRHEGQIEVESEVDRGTTFRVRLPLESEAFAERADGEDGERAPRVSAGSVAAAR